MASKAVVKAAGGVMGVSTKYTTQSTGIFERIRRAFAIDPERSNGVPLNPQFRWPTPGGNDPLAYDDPVTCPAGDIADNPYWKRDVRRNYPALSVVSQADAVALLTVGNAKEPRVDLIGEAGAKELVRVEGEGDKGLAAFFETGKKDVVAKDLLVAGLPPLPSGQSLTAGTDKWEVYKYEVEKTEQSYPPEYPCRSFA